MCDACWADLRAAAGILLRFDAADAITCAGAVDVYDGRLKDVVHALKYDRRRSISPRLGALMRERGAEILNGADCVTPVPLHPIREYQRGFNQAHDLAIHLGVPVMPLLKRIVHTHSQIDLPREERLRNVHDAFAMAPGSRLPVPGVVVLVDDVATTGATLEQCAMVLQRGGVREVRAFTAARVVTARR